MTVGRDTVAVEFPLTRRPRLLRRVLAVATAVVALCAVGAGPGVGAQESGETGSPPATTPGPYPTSGLWAPAWTTSDVPAPVRIASVQYRSATADAPGGSIEVRLAGPFELPGGRWRVSVGLGDPDGVWKRLSMEWDGTASFGSAVEIDGLDIRPIGVLDAAVDTAGSVTFLLPIATEDADVLSGVGGVVWAESVLGPDAEPEVLVRTPWFPRASVLGDGAPRTVSGGSVGVLVGTNPPGVGTVVAPSRVDTGAPSVVEGTPGSLSVDVGTVPESVAGADVESAVDLLTFIVPSSADAPPSGPQVRIDLLGGTVDGTDGTALGPLAGPVSGSASIPSDTSWIEVGPPVVAGGAGTLDIDVEAFFAASGRGDVPDDVSVNVTRVVNVAGGGVIVAPGVAAAPDAFAGGPAASSTTVPPVTEPPAEPTSTTTSPVVVAIGAGVLVGAIAILVAMLIADALARRRRPEPRDIAGGYDDLDDTPQMTHALAVPPGSPVQLPGELDVDTTLPEPVAPTAPTPPTPSQASATPERLRQLRIDDESDDGSTGA